MADEQDLALLRSGALDLSYCDFAGADISGADLPRRNFGGAMLKSLKAEDANLSGANFPDVVSNLDDANFARANLRGASFRSAHLRKINFTAADLRGANFEGAHIDEFTKFDDVITDKSTVFEGAHMMRKTSRSPAFKRYDLVDGRLKRKKSSATSLPQSASAASVRSSDMVLPSLGSNPSTVSRSFTTNVSSADIAGPVMPTGSLTLTTGDPTARTAQQIAAWGNSWGGGAHTAHSTPESPAQSGPPSLESIAQLAADFQNRTGQPLPPITAIDGLLRDVAAGTGTAAGIGTADFRGQAIYPELIARIEEQERALKELTAEVATIRAELRAHAERSRFEPGGNYPPEEINIDDALHDVEIGIASLRILRASLGGELPQFGAEIQKLVLQVAYEGLKRAWRAVVSIGKWLFGKADKVATGVAIYAGEQYFGPKAMAYVENNLPQLIKDLEPVLRSLGM